MRRLNINQTAWFIILLGLSYYIFYLVITGGISSFIHPRMAPYIYFALGALMVMTGFQATRILGRGERKLKKGYAVFLLPLVAGLLLNPGKLNEEITRTKGIVIGPGQTSHEHTGGSSVEDSVRNGIITLTEDNFADVLYSIWSNPEEYTGRRISAEGFVYMDGAMEEKQLILARMIINCCAADSMIVGMAAEYHGQLAINESQWISISGTIRMMDCINPYTNVVEKVPGVYVEDLEIIEKPENPYVYQ